MIDARTRWVYCRKRTSSPVPQVLGCKPVMAGALGGWGRTFDFHRSSRVAWDLHLATGLKLGRLLRLQRCPWLPRTGSRPGLCPYGSRVLGCPDQSPSVRWAPNSMRSRLGGLLIGSTGESCRGTKTPAYEIKACVSGRSWAWQVRAPLGSHPESRDWPRARSSGAPRAASSLGEVSSTRRRLPHRPGSVGR
jgi:hypothetical protein